MKYSKRLQRKHNSFRRPLHGFTLIELLVVIAIISVLASVLLPGLRRVKEQILSSQCLSNLTGMGMVFMTYANDHNGRIPPTGLCGGGSMWGEYISNSWWTNVLVDGEYVEVAPVWPEATGNWAWGDYWGSDAGVMQCPITRVRTDTNKTCTSTYGYPSFTSNVPPPPPLPSPRVNYDYRLSRTSRASERLLLIDGSIYMWSDAGAGNLIPNSGHVSTRHSDDSANVLFMDGHAATFREEDIFDPANDWYGAVNE